MSRSFTRTASAALIVILLASLLLLLPAIKLPENGIGQPPIVLPDPHTDRPLQGLYQLQADAARSGWTSDNLRLAGDLWREMGDPTRAVAYWEAVAKPDASLLHDRAQAYIDLQRWADASDALTHLLTLLPPNSSDQ